MLSGETAKGKYPTLAIETMSRICHEVEEHLDYEHVYEKLFEYTDRPMKINELMASSAVKVAYETRAKLLFNVTETGLTARCMSKYRPPIPIISLTSNPTIARQSMMLRGVIPYLLDPTDRTRSLDDLIKEAYQWSVNQGYIVKTQGDIAICLHDMNPWDLEEEASDLRIIKI